MKCRSWALAGVFAWSFGFLLPAQSNASEPTIGWERFKFSGNLSFSDEQLRTALIAEPEFLLATHPKSDRSTIGATCDQLLIAGYQNSGFKSPRLTFQGTSDGGGMITIDEGQRYRCGKVNIRGANTVDAQQLIERLTQPYAKDNSFPTFVECHGETITRWVDAKGKSVDPEAPVWQLGSFVKFGTEGDINKKVVAALKDLGYSSGKAVVTIQPNDVDSTAELAVQILDEGPNDIAEVFHVEGTQTNSPNAVLSFLELKSGIAVNRTLVQSVTKRLWDCGRFKTHNVHFDRDEDGRGRLNVELTDVKGVPSLADPMSEAAIVFMRARTWLNSVDDRNEDVSLSYREKDLEFHVVQSQQGLLVQLRSEGERDERLVLMFDDKFVTYLNKNSKSHWRASAAQFDGKVRLEMNFSAAAEDEKFVTLNLSGTCSSRRSKNESPFSSSLHLSPADWSGFAYKNILQTQSKDGRLHVAREHDRLEIDVATGQIYHWEGESSEVRIEAGLFGKLKKEIDDQTISTSNDYDASRPVSSLSRHLFSPENWESTQVVWKMHYGDTKPFERSLAPAIVKLVDGELLRPLDAFAVHTANEQANDKFDIPFKPTMHWDFRRNLMQFVGKYGLRFAPEVFAEDTWPMSVTREACLVMVNRGKHTGAVLQDLQADPSNGPLCDASIAFLLSLIQQQPIASTFAQRSLEGLTPERLHADVETLMSGPSGQWMASVLAACKSLTTEEIESFKAIGLSDCIVIGLYALKNQGTMNEESYLYQVAKDGIESVLRGIVQR